MVRARKVAKPEDLGEKAKAQLHAYIQGLQGTGRDCELVAERSGDVYFCGGRPSGEENASTRRSPRAVLDSSRWRVARSVVWR